jgi:aryl-phospho-beta-D-glucosidase BglC (GH1 family)
MYLNTYATAILGLATITSAWMPGDDKSIVSVNGTNLFQSTNVTTSSTKRSFRRSVTPSSKIRGVNMGSLFVFEPWIATSTWSSMGCGRYKSEFDCVKGLGQTAANKAFQSHWASWITKSDITQMQSYGLNTIRVPIGYWMKENLVYSNSEYFPQGGLAYLQQLCGWASDAGFYIIIDMHGAPGAQVVNNAFTGQYASTVGFYVDYQYERATAFLSWLTTQIHTNNKFRNVGMIGLVNEPIQNTATAASMISKFYPNAYAAIRAAESSLNITATNSVHIQVMSSQWGSGDPNSALTDAQFMAYDDHRYLKWDSSVPVSQSAYISESCTDNRNPNNQSSTIVGEFSLSVPDNVEWTSAWNPSSIANTAFYKKWFAAQVTSYEAHTSGWIFWTWKSQLGDYRWSYQDAVAAGVIPTNIDDAFTEGVC